MKAAHICGKAHNGSDDWRNGLPLCSTHHDAFDTHLFAIHPDSLIIETMPGVPPSSASASSFLHDSNCCSRSAGGRTCALAFVPVERSLRPRVGLFAPLRDKVTSSAQPQGSSLSILTEPHDELAATAHSITSSARASSVGGTSRPSDLAVFRLMTSSYLVGACTGRSAGFSPLRIRSTYPAARRY